MTIKFTSTYGSFASGSTYTLSDMDEENFIGLGVAANVDTKTYDALFNAAGNLIGIDGLEKAALPLDASGNAIGNINLRTGALASLLTLAGGNGEIGVTTDTKSLVLFNGTPGGAINLTGQPIKYEMNVNLLGNNVAAGVQTGVFFPAIMYDPRLLLNTAVNNGNITSPAPGVTISAFITGTISVFNDITGTYRELYLQVDTTGAGVWEDVAMVQVKAPSTAPVIGTNSTPTILLPIFMYVGNVGTAYKFRFLFRHDCTTAQSITAGLDIKFV